MKKCVIWLICLAMTMIGYFLIDVGYSLHSHMSGLLLKGFGGGILTVVGCIINEFEKCDSD